MKKNSIFRVVFFLSLFVLAGRSQAEFPGVSPGSFSVSDSGSANYSIPISTPAGIAGMSPDLAVNYSSSGGNGILGVGFQLSGFSSSIHRCGGSHATDGQASGVTYSTNDKVCMNGQRLVIAEGMPWSEGAVYRSELDSFSKVVYTNGKFLHYARDGSLTWYAWRVTASTKSLRWLMSSQIDRSGNIVRYTYQHLAGEYWLPKEVQWTGKGTDRGNRKAVFTYKLRPDKRFSYDYGVKREHKHLLDTITTTIDGNQIKQYEFLYQKSPVSRLSRLRYVRQYGADGGQLPQQEFIWNNTQRGFSTDGYTLPVRVYDYKDIKQDDTCGTCNDGYAVEVKRGDFVDVNADGYVDFVEAYRAEENATFRNIYKNTGSNWVKLQTEKPPFVMRDYKNTNSDVTGEMIQQATYADINGDGYPDIVRAIRNGDTYIREVRLNIPGTFKWRAASIDFMPPTVLWDYNHLGDGKGKSIRRGYIIDVNGDGLPDWVASYLDKNGTNIRTTWINTGTKWVGDDDYKLPPTAIIDDYRDSQKMEGTPVNRTEFVDINGDGLVDLIQGLKSPDKGVDKGKVYRDVWLNTGSGWNKVTDEYRLPDFIHDYTRVNEIINGQPTNDSVQRRGGFIDVNGDGLVDWVRSYRDFLDGQAYKTTWLNTGKGWSRDDNYKLPGAVLRHYNKHFGGDPHGPESGSFFDINRDGLIDWVVAHKNRFNQIVKETYLNTGTGWPTSSNETDEFPDIFMDNVSNEGNKPMHFGGLMDLNADGAIDYLMSTKPQAGSDIVKTYMGNAKPADMIIKITDSLGAQTSVAYKPMSDKTVYRALSPLDNPDSETKVMGASPLVSYTLQSNGMGGVYRLDYYYSDAAHDRLRGSMGFKERRVWDRHRRQLSVVRYAQPYPHTGTSIYQSVYTADSVNVNGLVAVNGKVLSTTTRTLSSKTRTMLSGKRTYTPLVMRTKALEYEFSNGASSPIRTVWTDTIYDAFDNPRTITAITRPGNKAYGFSAAQDFRQITYTDFANDEDTWLIGMATRVRVKHSAPNQADQLRTTTTTYNGNGLPTISVVEPNKTDFKLTTTFNYDDYGNQIQATVTGNGITPRVSKVIYDDAGMHVLEKIDPLNHKITITPDPICDAPQATTDANGLVTTIEYDQYCRQTRVNHPDNTWAITSYYTGPLRIVRRAKASPTTTTYFDTLGRDYKVNTQGFDGRMIIAEKEFNSKGQITRESLPYYAGETKQWTQFNYDSLGRLYETISADGSVASIDYAGLTTRQTNALGQTFSQTQDVIGRLVKVTDAHGENLSYRYDAVGNLLNTTDPKDNEVKMGYDHAGRKIWMDDPDMGRWTYEYDVLGQLVKQTDSNNNVITSTYDLLGRLKTRTTAEGISRWTYDDAANGVGKLRLATGPHGYRRMHKYDNLSRPSEVFETVDGLQARSFVSYDSNGRVRETRYPGPKDGHLNGGQSRFIHVYNTRGYLTKVQELSNQSGSSVYRDLWVAQEVDAKGNITQERYGNGVNVNRSYHPTRNYVSDIIARLGSTPIQDLNYEMDAIGNLTKRFDRLQNVQELFEYDDLNRLTKSTTRPNSPTPAIVDYQYDELGNIEYRSDVGSMYYGERGYGPHAVTSIRKLGSTMAEDVFNPYGNYNYDANGNLIQNKDRSIAWTSFNKPRQMATKIGGEIRGVSYTYGPDFQRTTKTTMNGEKHMRYYGGGSSEYIVEGSQQHWKYYVSVGSTTLELKYKKTGTNGYNEVENQYLFKDHLGSTDVIVDNNGTIVERLSFNPWGERRNSNWTESNGEIESSSNRGFTGHEMDDEIGLVNMNARIYDPVIGRFLSPDALIPSPTDLQSYNRYSYVRNNPLSFTDPSGFERVKVPGTGAYYYDTGSGKFYSNSLHRDCEFGSCRDSDAQWKVKTTEVTDPGMKNHLVQRIGVANHIIKNYGGLSRGNAKETRNQALADARAAIGCSDCSSSYLIGLRMQGGQSAAFNAAIDRHVAAGDIYLSLKRQARSRYRKIAAQVAVVAISVYTGAYNAALANSSSTAVAATALTNTQMALFQSVVTFTSTGGDIKAALVTAASFGAIGPQLSNLKEISNVVQITAHGVWGGVSAEILGGGFVEGFAGAAVGKAISQRFTSYTQGEFHWDQFAATVAGGALAAEIAGGDPIFGAGIAAMGYMINQAANYSVDSLKGQANVAQSRGAVIAGTANSQMMMIKSAAPYVRFAAYVGFTVAIGACGNHPICGVPLAITMIATESYNYRVKVPYQASTSYQQQQYFGKEYIERFFPQKM